MNNYLYWLSPTIYLEQQPALPLGCEYLIKGSDDVRFHSLPEIRVFRTISEQLLSSVRSRARVRRKHIRAEPFDTTIAYHASDRLE